MQENNLLIISNNFPNRDNSYIADIFVKEQVNYLKKYFNEIYVISPVAYGIEHLRKTKHQDYQYDNVKVFFPRYPNIPFCYSHGRSIWISLETRAILNLIRQEKLVFDVIHAHFTWPSGVVAVALKRILNIPVIITEGSSRTFCYELNTSNKYYINAYQKCDAIIRNNHKDIPLLLNAGISAKKIWHVVYGYDEKKFYHIPKNQAREKIGIEPEIKVILNISRLSEEKGHKYLISAMADIVNNYPELICYIGGNGPLYEVLQKQIHFLHLENNIKLIGFVPDDAMSLWMNAADFFVLPSLSEGNPTVMFECLGCGVPFIGTKVGGIPEVITSEDYGMLVEPGDSDELSEKILQALYRDWNWKGIRSYAEQYTSENTVNKIIGIYNEIQKT